MRGYGWRLMNERYYSSDNEELDEKQVEKDSKELLSKVKKGESWTDPRGIKHIPLLLNDEVVGQLFDDVEDPKSMGVASYWVGRFGVKVDLAQGKKVVGMLWLK
ncbi:MAG: hypothetical protein OH316_02190 [Candidatus Parvarchaeota archaeon]|nr:hypothetical protein [Candidatus Parvarchaeota archaeon]